MGYATPSWYIGGHPDMYGAAATLYTLLTGNSPDKIGRAAFLWPPQGEKSLSEAENDLTRILEKSGPNTFPLLLRADIPLTWEALNARKLLVERMRETMAAGDYGQCLNLLERATKSVLAWSDTPVPSLLRALLLQRMGRDAEAEKELDRPCHRENDPRLVEARVSLMDALGKWREAATLLTRMLAAVKPADDALGEQSLPLLGLRANIRAALGDCSGVLADQKAALALIPDQPPARLGLNLSIDRYKRDIERKWIRENWEKPQSRFPGYAAFVKSQPEK